MTSINSMQTSLPVDRDADRRRDDRRRVLKGARLAFNRGYGALETVVKNLSARGALLSFGDTMTVPTHFDLLIAGEVTPRKASVRWRSLTAVGVVFD
jgi:hypothetical protein